MASTAPISARLQDSVRYAVAVETEQEHRDFEAAGDLAEIWTARLAHLLTKIETRFRQCRPELVVLVQGFEPVNAVVRAAALGLGIPTLAIENTALKTHMLWDNVAAVTTNRNLAKNFFWRYHGAASRSEVEEFALALVADLRGAKSVEHVAPAAASAPDDERPNVIFLAQVLTDSSLIFGLGAWSSPLEVISAVLHWCQRNGYRLLLKLHPKESMGRDPIFGRPYDQLTLRKMRARPELMAALEANRAVVDSDNQFDTYALIAQSEIAVTINSQAGLEAALLGKPTVICGDSFYRGLGFTLDVTHPVQFDLMMDLARRFEVPYAAKEFAFIFYERYCRPRTVRGLVDLVAEQLQRHS